MTSTIFSTDLDARLLNPAVTIQSFAPTACYVTSTEAPAVRFEDAIKNFLQDNKSWLSSVQVMALISADREVLSAPEGSSRADIIATLKELSEFVTGDFQWGYLKAIELVSQ